METNDEIFISNLSGDFENQVQELLQYVRLTRHEVEGLQRLFDDLQETLHTEWQGCRVLAFGSIVTGLGIKTSDVDCYVDLPRWLSPPNEAFVKRARNILRRRSQIFQNLFAIVGAKVPIVKFYHVPTRRNCDVSFSSLCGVQNSKLLAYLLQIDTRILPLTIIIKYWSKVHNLTGTNLMASYALTLLVIFYLQQRDILPPVQCVQHNQRELVIDNWNMAFDEAHHTSGNNESLFNLLAGFFNYYATFPYEKFIISPYLGRTIEKKLFSNIETVPDGFSLYKSNVISKICAPLRLNSLMCIQDPFEHNKNCSVAVHPKLYNAIIMSFDRAARAADDEIKFLRNMLTRTNITWRPAKSKRPAHNAVPRQASRGITKHKNNRHHNQLRQNIKKNLSHNTFKRNWTGH